MGAIRALVPRPVRHAISAQRARLHAMRLRRDLAALASGGRTIVAGPWLGEVGFELLYWAPFLAWFVDEFRVAPERLEVVSRGGTASWYPAGARYREIFEYLSPDDFRRRHDERVAHNGEQKQTQVLAFERDLLRQLTPDVRDRVMLHPSTMYRLFAPFWWGHVDERWVHRFARYRALTPPPAPSFASSPPYVAVKFYFNDCFQPTDANRAFVRRALEQLVERGRVVSLTTGLQLDDHGICDVETLGVEALPRDLDPRENLAVQSAIVAGATGFVGTYGGFAYLAPFFGVPSTAYYSDARGFSPSHLTMARSAFAAIGANGLLDARGLHP
jgi:hypothetical protein